ncbi:MAG: LUD domain-containing protein [Halobacteriaceae archaeon]
MSADLALEFESALDDIGVTTSRTDPEGFADAVADVVRPPAVGAEIPFDGVSLEDGPVTVDPTPTELREATTGVGHAACGVAAHGTLAVPSDSAGTEPVSLYPERHVAVVRSSDLVADMSAATAWLSGEFDAGRTTYVFATGPSSTGDMGELVYGVHGPREVHVLVLEEGSA